MHGPLQGPHPEEDPTVKIENLRAFIEAAPREAHAYLSALDGRLVTWTEAPMVDGWAPFRVRGTLEIGEWQDRPADGGPFDREGFTVNVTGGRDFVATSAWFYNGATTADPDCIPADAVLEVSA